MRIGTQASGVGLSVLNNLQQAMFQLAESSLRLSTLQRINRGSDDPAGLIAAETLRSELASIQAVNATTSRATGVVHVADSALAGVGDLVRSMRSNVLEVAGGMLSEEQVAAKQIEIDAALAAIDRIGQTTSFGGQKLFVETAASGTSSDEVTLTFNFSLDGEHPSTLNLPKVDTSVLGGTAGTLSDLASGGSASLSSENWAEAVKILDGAQDRVLEGRAEAGSFERYTIEASQTVLDSMEESITSAVSAIADTDIATELSRQVRAETLIKVAVALLPLITSSAPPIIGART